MSIAQWSHGGLENRESFAGPSVRDIPKPLELNIARESAPKWEFLAGAGVLCKCRHCFPSHCVFCQVRLPLRGGPVSLTLLFLSMVKAVGINQRRGTKAGAQAHTSQHPAPPLALTQDSFGEKGTPADCKKARKSTVPALKSVDI
ncbi:hypothetical protein QQF64_001022 [Cirrhinus molitorella]|uniref:Uncharacterized protein n=1 Tax=Cirrhinus molitorella TaxID=172907 RepID=A0ABR3NZ79_9TELE